MSERLSIMILSIAVDTSIQAEMRSTTRVQPGHTVATTVSVTNTNINISSLEDCHGSIALSQYNALQRRRQFTPEHRLLCAVLEEAIRNYLAITECSTRRQQTEFKEVRNWFERREGQRQGVFSFQSICDLLEIDSGLILKRLESVRADDLPRRGIGRANRIKWLDS